MKLAKLSISLIIISCVFVFSANVANAQTRFGVRGGYYTDAENGFLGGEFLSPFAPNLYINPNLEYVFIDGGTLMTINGDVHYDFPTGGDHFLWAGAGLGISYLNPDGNVDSQTDVGLNLFGGFGIPTRSVIPYFQAKVIVSDNSDFVLGFGLRF